MIGRSVVQLEMEEAVSSKQEDIVMKRLSPLLYSMRLFGLYFTRKQRVSPAAAPELIDQQTRRCPDWNFARIYSTVMLVVSWFNAIRFAMIFDGNETLGAALFMKLAIIPASLMNIIHHTSCYIASHTGSLDRVLRDTSTHVVNNTSKYDRLMKVVMVISWLLVAWNVFHYAYQLFTSGRLNDLALISLSKTLSETHLNVVKVIFIVLQLQTVGVWIFPLVMNFVVMMLLCDQFDKLNAEFSRCVGDGGEFSGNFEQFRRRHQANSHSVHEADSFFKIINVASFCGQFVTIILTLYSTIFFRDDTISVDVESTFLYIAWLGLSISGLALFASQAVVLNHRASTITCVCIHILSCAGWPNKK